MISMKISMCLALILYVIVCYGDNVTEKYITMKKNSAFQTRQNRLLSFHTEDKDIDVELSFSIPFITIPVKTSLEMAKSALVNVNLAALAFGGVLAFAAAVLIPGIIFLLTKTMTKTTNTSSSSSSSSNQGYRSDDVTIGELWRLLDIFDGVLLENGIDAGSCTQKMVCWLAKNANRNVKNGQGSNQDKFVEAVATSSWLHTLIGGTAIETALHKGLDEKNCMKEYQNCKINQQSLTTLREQFANLIQREK